MFVVILMIIVVCCNIVFASSLFVTVQIIVDLHCSVENEYLVRSAFHYLVIMFFVTMLDEVDIRSSNENMYLEWNICQYFIIIFCSVWVQSLIGMHMHHSKVASSHFHIFKTIVMLFALSSPTQRSRHLSVSLDRTSEDELFTE
jgi:hypothetical protein